MDLREVKISDLLASWQDSRMLQTLLAKLGCEQFCYCGSMSGSIMCGGIMRKNRIDNQVSEAICLAFQGPCTSLEIVVVSQ